MPVEQLIRELTWGKCGEEPRALQGWPRQAFVSGIRRAVPPPPPQPLLVTVRPRYNAARWALQAVLSDALWPDCRVFECRRSLTLLCSVPGELSVLLPGWHGWGSVGTLARRKPATEAQSGHRWSRRWWTWLVLRPLRGAVLPLRLGRGLTEAWSGRGPARCPLRSSPAVCFGPAPFQLQF